MIVARILIAAVLMLESGMAVAAEIPTPVLDFLKSENFEIRAATANRLLAERTLPEDSPWMACSPAYYDFAGAGVVIEIADGTVYTRIWERRAHTNRFSFVRDCESSGVLEAKLRTLLTSP